MKEQHFIPTPKKFDVDNGKFKIYDYKYTPL